MTEEARTCVEQPAIDSLERRALHDFGYFGHFLHVHAGGRSGKQHVLTKLYFRDGHLTQRELLEASCISSAALSEVLSKLEGEGLIERSRSERDKRQLDIRLTKAGRTRAERLAREKAQFERDCLAILTEEEKNDLVTMLDRIREHWDELEGEKGQCNKS
jgi:DNA-binding MarR family transcriptional regulator